MISGFLGAFAGSFAFVSSYQFLTNVFYSNIYQHNIYVNKVKNWDFRYKNILIYSMSDVAASVLKAPFEVRK